MSLLIKLELFFYKYRPLGRNAKDIIEKHIQIPYSSKKLEITFNKSGSINPHNSVSSIDNKIQSL